MNTSQLRKLFRPGLLICVLLATSGFKHFRQGDVVELSNSINARSSLNFKRSANNIQFLVKAGTMAKVITHKALQSGNYGLQVELIGPDYDSKPLSQRTVWLYDRADRQDDIRGCADKKCSTPTADIKVARYAQALTQQQASSALIDSSSSSQSGLGALIDSAEYEIQSLKNVSDIAESYTCSSNAGTRTCMICNCYHEARGEPVEGKAAVNFVVLARANSSAYSSNVCSVIYQYKQFSWTPEKGASTIRTSRDRDSVSECVRTVDYALQFSNVQGPMWFHTTRISKSWTKNKTRVATIDNHVFFSAKSQPSHFQAQRQTLAGTANQNSTLERQAGAR